MVRGAPRYFILFEVFIKGAIFMTSFFSPIFICIWETYWFCELILHPDTSLKVFISCKSSVEFLGSLVCSMISHTNKDTLNSSFPTCIPLIYFINYLNALAKTSGIILSRFGERVNNLVLYFILVELLWVFCI